MKATFHHPLFPHYSCFWTANIGPFLPPRPTILPQWLLDTIEIATRHGIAGRCSQISLSDGEEFSHYCSFNREVIRAEIRDGYTKAVMSSLWIPSEFTTLTFKTLDTEWSFQSVMDLPNAHPQTWFQMYKKGNLSEKCPILSRAFDTIHNLLAGRSGIVHYSYRSRVKKECMREGFVSHPEHRWVEGFIDATHQLYFPLEMATISLLLLISPTNNQRVPQEGMTTQMDKYVDGLIFTVRRGDTLVFTFKISSQWGEEGDDCIIV